MRLLEVQERAAEVLLGVIGDGHAAGVDLPELVVFGPEPGGLQASARLRQG